VQEKKTIKGELKPFTGGGGGEVCSSRSSRMTDRGGVESHGDYLGVKKTKKRPSRETSRRPHSYVLKGRIKGGQNPDHKVGLRSVFGDDRTPMTQKRETCAGKGVSEESNSAQERMNNC